MQDLFDLIKNLSPNEKGNLKKQSFGGSKSQAHLKLFDLIDKMPSYDRAALKTQAIKAKVCSESSFGGMLTYLYENLLRSLAQPLVRDRKNVNFRIQELLQHAEVLSQKKMLGPATDRLNTAKRLAYEYHQYHYLIEIIQKEINWVINGERNELREKVEELYKEFREVVGIIQEEREYRSLHHQLLLLQRIRNSAPAEVIGNYLANIRENRVLNSGIRPRSFFAHYYKHIILLHLAREIEQFDDAYQEIVRVVEIWDEHPHMQRLDPEKYLNIHYNQLVACTDARKFPELLAITQKVDKLLPDDEQHAPQRFFCITCMEFLYYLRTWQLEKASSLEKQMVEGLQKYRHLGSPSEILSNYYNLCVLYLLKEEFEDLLECLENILFETKEDPRKDAKRLAIILQLIGLYELNQDEAFHRSCRKADRHFRMNGEIDTFENHLLRHIRKLPSYQFNEPNWKQAFLSLRASIEPYSKQPGFDEIDIWAEARATGRSLAEVLAQRGRKDDREEPPLT
ncbi:MAG: hypothetical protein KDC32_22085 [Saprospiraceae bacterium]|nr:hypothetical protein [Saprospiraceae bacterium]